MAVTRTINFLPGFYKTQANSKFLSATLDHLVSEPSHTRLHGYVGRRTATNYRSSDNYISESTSDRARYQLEPSVVVKDDNGEPEFVAGYQDLINKLQYSGVDTSNHSRLFGNEYYAYDGLFDFDKLVNFSQYYWLPNGPDSVNVFGTNVPISRDFDITANYPREGATVADTNSTLNPTLTVARGGSYDFNALGFAEGKLWIQTEPGTSGFKQIQSNVPSREVLGVYNNGTSKVTFNVPQSNAQDQYLLMNRAYEVDLATTLNYSDLHNRTFDDVIAKFTSIDGQRNLVGKTIIFLHDDADYDDRWTTGGIFDDDTVNGYDSDLFDDHLTVPQEQRWGVWQVSNNTLEGAIIKLTYVGEVPVGDKVLIREGTQNGNREYYKNAEGRYSLIPVITAPVDTLFYQDSSNPSVYGMIKLVDPVQVNPLDVDNDIIGKQQYVSPNGVELTNGLKIKFDASVTPEKYVNKTYYVEGVGTSIKLVDASNLVTPEPYTDNLTIGYDIDLYDASNFETTLDAPVNPSYITINRGSEDLNPWTRSNRWFHQDVINATSKYNNYTPVIDQAARATRPIIEFNSNLQLFNFGKVGKTRVNLFDTATTDAWSNVVNQESYSIDGVDLTPGMRVIFSADTDDAVRNKIYIVRFEDFEGNGTTTINLELAEDGEVELYDSIIVTQGATLQANTYWFDGSEWVEAQKKVSLNQAPKFDVFDANGYSLSNTSIYPESTFDGTNIFSYKRGTGSNGDSVLGFPLTYRNFNNIGDIVFANNYDSQTFEYSESGETVVGNISKGYLHINTGVDSFENKNVWTKINQESRQYQTFTYTYEGDNKFLTGITPDDHSNIPNTLLYVNGALVSRDEYSFVEHKTYLHMEVTSELNEGDRLVLYVYSSDTSQYGYYQVPSNLDNNSVNSVFETLTLGQMRNNVKQTFESSIDAVGTFPGASNIRDIVITDNPGKILQHSAPLTYGMLFLTHPVASFEKSIDYAKSEYARFKNKLLERALISEMVSENDIPTSLDFVIEELSGFKTADMPWYASDMLPWGDDYNEVVHDITNATKLQYEITEIFDDKSSSNQAVTVYLNGEQLLKDMHYTFPSDAPAVLLDANTVALAVGDKLIVREYPDTDGCWIPETPSKLGLYPAYMPRKYLDTTYQEPQEVIQGHDGSITIAFGDFRDDLLLEFEKRVYNNIKAVYDPVRFDINEFIPSKFRTTAFSRTEIDSILAKSFLTWAGLNRLDYITNEWYDNSNGFTWNYSKFVDKMDGEPLKGSWKSVYHYYFDTCSPNQTPWEMLGFSIKPAWWESEYGPAPYTSGNEVLWDHLEEGRILHGDRQGVDSNYARTGLSSILPVNEYGDLLSPHEFLVQRFEPRNANLSFTVGDLGPVEAAWRRSSDYPYAIQKLLAMTAPAKFFGLQIDTIRYRREGTLGQYVYSDTNQRITQGDVKINGEEYNGSVFRTAGYINWIADYTRSLGLSAEEQVGNLVRNFDVNLSYKVAGFTDKTMLKIFAEQASPTSTNESVLIPDEDFGLALTKSVPLERLVYSAVIVTKSNAGWTVEGYDFDKPYFNVIPSDVNGKSTIVESSGVSVTAYSSYLKEILTIPYGYEFTSRQQVVDFLLSYERYLRAQGFRFNQNANELKSIANWTLSAKEFMAWSTQGWAEGNIIVLSPVSTALDLAVTNSAVDDLNDFLNSGKILDVNFRTLGSKEFSVTREQGRTQIQTFESIIGFAELTPVQYEHVAVFNNNTVFNDVIYQPELGNRQQRLKIIGKKTADWDGTLFAPGYILNQSNVPEWVAGKDYKKGDLVTNKGQLFVASKNLTAQDEFSYSDWKVSDYDSIKQGLLPNFANKAAQLENAYNLEGINLEDNIDVFSKGLIGFRQRDYLNEIGIDDASQVKFYQGMIREKGTKSSIDRLTSAQFDRLSSDIDYFEDWAFRVGDYGSQSASETIEILLPESQFGSTPSFLSLIDDNDDAPLDTVAVKYSDLHKRPRYWNKDLLIAQTEEGKDLNKEMKVAGFARMDDVDFAVFDLANASELDININEVGANSIIWTANDFNSEWNIYEVETTSAVINAVYNAQQGYVMLETADQHDFEVNDVLVVKNISGIFDGFYRVKSVPELNQLLVQFTKFDLSTFESSEDLDGYVLKLESRKYQYASDIANTPATSWRDGNLAWVEDTDNQGSWAVYEKSTPWEYNQDFELDNPLTDAKFGGSITKNQDGTAYAAVYRKDATTVGVVVYHRVGNTFTKTVEFDAFDGSYAVEVVPNFEPKPNSVAMYSYNDRDYVAVGMPTYNGNNGKMVVYGVEKASGSAWHEIAVAGSGIASLGTSVAWSKQGHWLFVAESNDPGYIYSPRMTSIFARQYANGDFELTVGGINYFDQFSNDDFGASMAVNNDGTKIAVGAPGMSVTDDSGNSLENAGGVVVFDMEHHTFIGDGSTDSFHVHYELSNDHVVYVNDSPLYYLDGYSYNTAFDKIVFDTPPAAGARIAVVGRNMAVSNVIYSDEPAANNEFGRAVALCPTNCSLYVGSPGDDHEGADKREAGEVYRYVNEGLLYGEVTGTVQNAVVSDASEILIDGHIIGFAAGWDVNTVSSAIRTANLPGITSDVVDGYLKIYSDSTQTFSKLVVTPVSGSGYADLGLEAFKFANTIENPEPTEHDRFGEVLSVSDDATKLAIGCPNSNMVIDMPYDDGETIFDDTSTTFRTELKNTGAVYVYQLMTNPANDVNNPANLVLAQAITASNASEGDNFGASVMFDGIDYNLYVGAPGYASNEGRVHAYTSNSNAWNIKHAKGPRVDVESINNVYLYNYVSGEKLLKLDYIDPAKGKILGVAAQDIDYIADIDPAYYNRGYSAQSVSNIAWGQTQVGKVWWDTTRAVWMDYEQGDNAYRTSYWGKLFPGSEINVYEWVESSVPPAQYEEFYNDGIPKSMTDYVVTSVVDPATGSTHVSYFFWATGATSVEVPTRSLTTGEIAQAIESPESYGVPYAVFTSQSTYGIYQVADYLINSDVVMHIGYDRVKNKNLLHSEYSLVQEGNALSKIPSRIVEKMIDSLCGQNAVGFPVSPGDPITQEAQVVPDPSLPEAEKYGILYRPRQSVFKDRTEAMRLLFTMANEYMATVPVYDTIAQNANFSAVHSAPLAGFDDTVYDLSELEYIDISLQSAGFVVLVEYDSTVGGWALYEKENSSDTEWTLIDQQMYNVTNYWSAVNWYAPGFENIARYSHAVETFNDLSFLVPADGEIFKVNDGGNGKYSLYYYSDENGFELVGLENSAVKFSEELWTNTPPVEARYILNGMAELFSGTEQMNHMLFALIRFALSEQKYLDWAFKTSFITIMHKIRKLSQYANYQKDNQDFVMEYINEVKPYRTKIREYLLDYEGEDYWNGDVTDFDLPGYYDVDYERFRSVSGELTKDNDYLDRPEHTMWRDNHTMYVDRIVVVDGGSNYDVPPQVTITGNGTGATAYAQIANGSVSKVVITNSGTGYTETPTISLSGGNGTGARLAAYMANDTTRKIATTVKFDRTTYDSAIVDWEPNTSYTVSDIISHEGEVYQVVSDFTSGETFEGVNLVVVADETFQNASDRTMAFYQPTKGMPTKDLKQLFSGIDYEGVNIQGAKFDEETNLVPGDNGQLEMSTDEYDAVIKSTFTDLALGTRPEDINVDGGAFVDTWNSHAPEELVPGIVFDTMDMQVYTLAPTDEAEAGYKIFMHTFKSDGVTTTYSVETPSHSDNILVYTKFYGYQDEGSDFTYDRNTDVVEFKTALPENDVIYIYMMTDSGVGKIYDNFLQVDGLEKEFTMPNVPYNLITDSLVIVDGTPISEYTVSESPDVGTLLVFDTAPELTQHVHVYFFSGSTGVKNYSEFRTQVETAPANSVYPADYTIDLDNELLYAGPLSGNFFVEVAGRRLRPANNSYYKGDGSTTEFFVPSSVDVNPDTISDNDIDVYVNGVEMQQYIDYDVVPSDGSSLRSVDLYTAPSVNDDVTISLQTGAEFRMNGNSQLLIDQNYNIPPQAEIRIMTFSNHDLLKLQTQVFIGSTVEDTTSEPGFDTTVFDSTELGWDGTYFSTVTRPVYNLNRPVTNTNYIWVTQNGRKLLPNYDFIMRSPTVLELGDHLNVSINDAIVVTAFIEDDSVHAIGYRTFQNMLGNIEYYRISDNHTTVLAKDLAIDDEYIYVRDASALPLPSPEDAIPGVVFIEGERITYYEIDYAGGRLSRLRRSTGGTGALQTIKKGATVVDASFEQIVPGETHTRIWLDSDDITATSGVGLMASSTLQAKFLKRSSASQQVISKTTSPGLGNDVYLQPEYVEDGYVYGNDLE